MKNKDYAAHCPALVGILTRFCTSPPFQWEAEWSHYVHHFMQIRARNFVSTQFTIVIIIVSSRDKIFRPFCDTIFDFFSRNMRFFNAIFWASFDKLPREKFFCNFGTRFFHFLSKNCKRKNFCHFSMRFFRIIVKNCLWKVFQWLRDTIFPFFSWKIGQKKII